jgi:hypothetical protein
MVNKDWSHWIKEDDDAATVTKMGAQIARQTPVRAGKKTPVDLHPDMKTPEVTKVDDGKGSTEVGKSFDRNNRPNDHRPSHIDYPSQKGPSNPQQGRLADMWKGAIKRDVDNRERSRRLQRPSNK